MKNFFFIALLTLAWGAASAQTPKIDSLLNVLKNEPADSIKIKLYTEIGYSYVDTLSGKAIENQQNAIALSKNLKLSDTDSKKLVNLLAAVTDKIQKLETRWREHEKQDMAIYIITVFCILFLILLVIAFVRINKAKQLLEEKNSLIDRQRNELQEALIDLKNAQEELVRHEKLASVGQLTKGIVDRMLNPLNYINNFSESSNLLVNELNELLSKHEGAISEVIKEEFLGVLELIKNSVTKIYDNGTTTTRIVKDMQQLLKEKSKEFSEIDLNVFVEKQAHEAYKEIKKTYGDFDGELIFDLEKQPIITKILLPEFSDLIEDILDNSLYILAKKNQSHKEKDFIPQVKISTELSKNEIILKIRDNGKGIPQRDLERLFNPFFTTKPTSEGTGLGLFMCKDIVEIHNGKIRVHSQEGQFTEVVITLPVLKETHS